MSDERESGFYWVHYSGYWEPAAYMPRQDLWMLIGMTRYYKQTEFKAIGERIEPPK